KTIRPNTKAIIMSHGSNVSGTILDLEEVGKICKKYNIYFIIDGAQTAGFLDIDIERLNEDVIGCTSHKGLLDLKGKGVLVSIDKILKKVKPLIEGGTGSLADA